MASWLVHCASEQIANLNPAKQLQEDSEDLQCLGSVSKEANQQEIRRPLNYPALIREHQRRGSYMSCSIQ